MQRSILVLVLLCLCCKLLSVFGFVRIPSAQVIPSGHTISSTPRHCKYRTIKDLRPSKKQQVLSSSSLKLSPLQDLFFFRTKTKKVEDGEDSHHQEINHGNFTRDGGNFAKHDNSQNQKKNDDAQEEQPEDEAVHDVHTTTRRSSFKNHSSSSKSNPSKSSTTNAKLRTWRDNQRIFSGIKTFAPETSSMITLNDSITFEPEEDAKIITVANNPATEQTSTSDNNKTNNPYSKSTKQILEQEENVSAEGGGERAFVTFPFSAPISYTKTQSSSSLLNNFTVPSYSNGKQIQGPYIKLPDFSKSFPKTFTISPSSMMITTPNVTAFNDAIQNVTALTNDAMSNMSAITAIQYNALLEQAEAAASAAAEAANPIFAVMEGGGNPGTGTAAVSIQPINVTNILASKRNMSANETITIADMEEILNEYSMRLQAAAVVDASLRRQQQLQFFMNNNNDNQQRQMIGNGAKSKKQQKSKKGKIQDDDFDDKLDATASFVGDATVKRRTKSGVAFPQPSILNYKTLKRTTAAAGTFFGMLIAVTILPNLWLMGCIAGGIYGIDIVTKLEERSLTTAGTADGEVDEDERRERPNRIALFLLACGRKMAKVWLQVYDYWQTLWFLYKTGQLSYEYYKVYENMDQRFAIQSKMDAWNSRFQQGKINFDNWEKENEIGRTVLAGLRTIWLVDEQSKRRAKESSKYRVVQYLYEVKYMLRRWLTKFKTFLKSMSNKSWYQEFLKGVRTDMKENGWDAIGTRAGAVVAALITVSITGALFTISPAFLFLSAVVVGIVWPSWVAELLLRLQELGDETRARGRGEEVNIRLPTLGSGGGGGGGRRKTLNTARLLGRYDKTKYSYFKRPDGTKRYYRTGQSIFKRKEEQPQDGNKINALFPWKTTNKKKSKRRAKNSNENWGLLSRFQSNNNQPLI